MTKTELEKDMKKAVGSSFISKTELASYLGYKKADSVQSIVKGLTRLNKKYFVPEVAERISNEIK